MTAALPPVSPADFKRGMRSLAAGVTIITTTLDGVRAGLTATAVCSVSAEPPQLLVCINREGGAYESIEQGRRLCVNVLAQHHQELAARFAGFGGIQGEDRFNEGQWITLATGCPVLADSLIGFDCEVAAFMHAGTHTVFVSRVVALTGPRAGAPLLYAEGDFCAVAPRLRVVGS